MKMTNLSAQLGATLLAVGVSCAQVPVTTTPDTPAPGPTAAAASGLSAGASEVVRLAEAGTTDDVLLAYIQNANSPFSLTADQILYLRDIGVSQPAITAMLNRDNALRNQPQTYTYNQTAYPPTVPPPAPIQPAAAPAVESAPTVPNAPTVDATPPAAPAQPAPVYVSSPPPDVTYFYGSLSPYGSWVTLDGIGWCWQPRVVVINRGWRPYCDGGHWVYSDCGWFWQSDYTWGWAPFHYGRWYLHDRCGWVWLPDRVWGPSWVVWRSEGSYCGWAPLPPHSEFVAGIGWRFNGVHVSVNFDFGLRPDCYTFVGMRDFDRHDLGYRRLPPTEVTRIYNHTTVINNYVVNNHTYVNHGIQVDRVRAATHAPMRPLAVREVSAPSPAMHSTYANRGELAVYRPELKAPARPEKMVAQKVDDRHPVIQHAPVVTGNAPYRGGTAVKPATHRPATQVAQPESSQATERTSHAQPAPSAPRSPTYTARPETQRTTTSPGNWEQPKPAARPNESRSVAAQPSPWPSAPKPDEPGRLYPLRTGPVEKPEAAPRNSHVYQPKGYYQAAETQKLPPLPKHHEEPTYSPLPPSSHGSQQQQQHSPKNQ